MGLDIVCTAHTPRAQFGDEEMKAGRRMRNRDSDQMGKRQVGRAYAREDVRSKKNGQVGRLSRGHVAELSSRSLVKAKPLMDTICPGADTAR